MNLVEVKKSVREELIKHYNSFFTEYYIPEKVLNIAVNDILKSSAILKGGHYNQNDISLACQRALIHSLNEDCFENKYVEVKAVKEVEFLNRSTNEAGANAIVSVDYKCDFDDNCSIYLSVCSTSGTFDRIEDVAFEVKSDVHTLDGFYICEEHKAKALELIVELLDASNFKNACIELGRSNDWILDNISENQVAYWIPWEECGAWNGLEHAKSDCIAMDENGRVLWLYGKEDVIELYEEYVASK